MQDERWVVHKFGGTSVASAERYRRVAEILERRPERRRAAVVSAMSGVTDALIHAVELASRRDEGYVALLGELELRHRETAAELLPKEPRERFLTRLGQDFADLADVLRASWLLRGHSRGVVDLVAGHGEVWSAQLLAGLLTARGTPAAWLDAREVLVVEADAMAPGVDWAASGDRLASRLALLAREPEMLVITGFVAGTAAGVPTTLGRNGSDYSASIFGALLGAREIHIWTDVDGVMSANPRLVPDAALLEELSYQEAMELAYFGAKVIHPSTMAPVVQHSIPLYIRNTFNPEHPGTRIHLRGASDFAVKGFATVEGVALVNVEGTGMIGVPGTAHRLFGALREIGVSVIMISQASSEHSICFAVPAGTAARVREAIERAFFAERHHGHIQKIEISEDCSILAVVGDRMAGHPGVAAKFFGAVGKAGVNIRAIAQGSSERNISVVIDGAETTRALRAVHSGFYLSPQTLSIGLIGPGTVGGVLLDQLAEQAARLKEEFNVDLRVRGILGSSRMLLAPREVGLTGWRGLIEEEAVAPDLDAFVAHVHADHLPHAVLIDCTAQQGIAERYAEWLARGVHIITPNKKANTGSLADYRRLRAAGREGGTHYLYETTVGAGLPIIQTLRDLIRTGDRVLEIEGILSGTLSYLFNVFDGSRGFSEILLDAKRKGYTEPDPREDLSGADVARKVVILAREMGLSLELGDVSVEGLVPPELDRGTVAEFLAALPDHDAQMTELLESARHKGQVLRFVGSVDTEGRASVRLRRYPTTHPFARIHLTDNVVQFRTQRYSENPLIVQGPGAGPEVTAGGIFADLLRLASYLGASL
ncbi:MAG TPA: bifunctional aspartate kinase/homoserine dehydrogenase I [Longimicrobiaceae bacterium]|nr:bifunctional aspartate kinase/homoserine dehydrogenase I [Longimicrobiaceae bacterium]